MIHETPTSEVFNEILNAAKSVWLTKDDTHGYVTEKLRRVNLIKNYADNIMICYRMFDINNQKLMREQLSEESLNYINNNL